MLWDALCDAPEDGADVAELMRMTGMRRSTVYKYLAQLAEQGRAVQVGWGRWRAADPGDGMTMSNCLRRTVYVHASRVSARKGA